MIQMHRETLKEKTQCHDAHPGYIFAKFAKSVASCMSICTIFPVEISFSPAAAHSRKYATSNV